MSDGTSQTLEQRKRALTRDVILDALAEVVADVGLHKFSVQDVADRAGVSHRTVYRHFGSREALVDALAGELDRLMERRDVPLLPDGERRLSDLVAGVFEVFDERPDLVRAVALGSLAGGSQPRSRRVRDREIRGWVEERGRGLPEKELAEASAVVRYLANSLSWIVLTRQLGLSSDEAARAVGWAVDTLLRDLEDRAGGVS